MKSYHQMMLKLLIGSCLLLEISCMARVDNHYRPPNNTASTYNPYLNSGAATTTRQPNLPNWSNSPNQWGTGGSTGNYNNNYGPGRTTPPTFNTWTKNNQTHLYPQLPHQNNQWNGRPTNVATTTPSYTNNDWRNPQQYPGGSNNINQNTGTYYGTTTTTRSPYYPNQNTGNYYGTTTTTRSPYNSNQNNYYGTTTTTRAPYNPNGSWDYQHGGSNSQNPSTGGWGSAGTPGWSQNTGSTTGQNNAGGWTNSGGITQPGQTTPSTNSQWNNANGGWHQNSGSTTGIGMTSSGTPLAPFNSDWSGSGTNNNNNAQQNSGYPVSGSSGTPLAPFAGGSSPWNNPSNNPNNYGQYQPQQPGYQQNPHPGMNPSLFN